MRNLAVLLGTSFILIASVLCFAEDEVISIVKLGPGTVETYEAALDLSNSTNTNVFIYFGADWCGYCVKMKNTTFKDKDVEKNLLKNFVVLKVDVDDKKFKNIKEKFKVKTLPNYLIIDKNENIIKRGSGYVGPKEFVDWLDN
jgi:thioredoxin-related protein